MAKNAELTQPDNGYFEVWTRECGHAVRVVTEYAQDWRARTPRMRPAEGKLIRERALAAPCRRCAEATSC